MSLSIHIPQFEGPLGLLLYLIRKEEMDIFDIDVHLITSQYLEYIKKMKQFDLEVAGDFIAMAATLIQIKSKMLLPNYNEEGELEEVEDPRKELVKRLIEYQKFQEVSKTLYDRPLLGRDVFRRGKSESIHSDEDGEIILDEGGLFSLIAYYRNSVRKMKKAIHRVATKTRSIAGRIMEMKDKFVVGQRIVMRDLITTAEEVKQELLITFLSCLEMGKMGLVSVYQSEVYGDIYLTAKREITLNAIERVEEYDSQGAEALADNLMDQAEEEALEAQEAQFDEAATETQEEQTSFQVATDADIMEAEEELSIESEAISIPEVANETMLTEGIIEESPQLIEEPTIIEPQISQSIEESESVDEEMIYQTAGLVALDEDPVVVESPMEMLEDNISENSETLFTGEMSNQVIEETVNEMSQEEPLNLEAATETLASLEVPDEVDETSLKQTTTEESINNSNYEITQKDWTSSNNGSGEDELS